MEDDLVFSGCIYNDEPDDDFYKLSVDDLKQMRLVGLPIRVEHHDTDSGEVLDSWVSDEGKAYVKWKFADNPRGWALAKLVRDGKVCELSLKHAEYGDGTKEAMEVSVVERGARPQTFIHRGRAVKYICASLRFKEEMADQQQPRYYERNADGTFAPVKEVPAAAQQVAAAAAPQQQPAAAPAAPVAEEPTKKREPTESLDARRMKVAKLAQVAEKILPLLSDSDLSGALVGSISDVIEYSTETESLIGALANEKQQLLAESEKFKNRDKSLAKEIVDGIVSLWGDLTLPPMDEDKKRCMLRVYEENPDFAHASQQMIIAASKIGQLKQAAQTVVQKSQLEILQDQLRMAQQKISAIGNMQGVPPASAPAPSWVPVAPQQAAPMVSVAASGKEAPVAAPPAASAPQFQLPDVLSNLPPFTGVVGNVRPSDIYTSRS